MAGWPAPTGSTPNSPRRSEHRAAEPGVGRSNVGGWHSATDMLDWGGAAAAKLADLATKAAVRLSTFEGRDAKARDWTVKMWANLSPPGALNMSHAHPGVLWAAVYYVDMGGASADDGGDAGRPGPATSCCSPRGSAMAFARMAVRAIASRWRSTSTCEDSRSLPAFTRLRAA